MATNNEEDIERIDHHHQHPHYVKLEGAGDMVDLEDLLFEVECTEGVEAATLADEIVLEFKIRSWLRATTKKFSSFEIEKAMESLREFQDSQL